MPRLVPTKSTANVDNAVQPAVDALQTIVDAADAAVAAFSTQRASLVDQISVLSTQLVQLDAQITTARGPDYASAAAMIKAIQGLQ